jgi:hypothetical protein
MLKTLLNISDTEQLVSTVNGKEMVKPGATFETEKADELLRNYKSLFELVPDEEKENGPIENTENEEEEIVKKPVKKSFKNK